MRGDRAARLFSSAAALLIASCVEPAICPPADLAPLASEPAYAFMASDYASSAVGLLDARGELLREAWLDSGTVPPGLVTPLSGDAVLASSSVAPCVLAVIDRYGTDVITLLDVCARGEVVLGQLDVGRSFAANPRDLVAIDDRRALVSRFTPNLDPDAPELERGNDVLVIDWREPRVLFRIDLGPLDSREAEHAYARPDRLVRLERDGAEVVIAGLARLTIDYAPGPGAVGIIDLATLSPRLLAIEGLVNCGEVDAVPDRPELAVVTCAGTTFGTADERRGGAGLALLELAADGSVALRGAWRAEEHAGAPVFDAYSVPLASDRVLSVAMGDLREDIGDHAAILDPSGGAASLPLFDAGSAFVLGDGAYDPSTSLLLVPDADQGVIRRFQMNDDGHRELEAVDSAPCRGLPPREVRRLSMR